MKYIIERFQIRPSTMHDTKIWYVEYDSECLKSFRLLSEAEAYIRLLVSGVKIITK